MKYELTSQTTLSSAGSTLYRIRSLEDITRPDIKKGDFGGFVESEKNLSQHGGSWVATKAQVYGDARVCGDAVVYGSAQVYDKAWVGGNAQVFGEAKVYGNASITGDAKVYGGAQVYGDARVLDYAKLSGVAVVYGSAKVAGSALIKSRSDIVWFSGVGTDYGTLTVYPSQEPGVYLATRGCFLGTTKDFLTKSNRVHEERIKNQYSKLIEVALDILKNSKVESVKAETLDPTLLFMPQPPGQSLPGMEVVNHNPVIKRVPFDYSKSNWAHAALNEVCMLLNIGEVANAHLFLREILANAPIESEPTVHQ